MGIYEFLDNFSEISFHTPGHKGRIPISFKDITEISGSDCLFEPKGIIKESMRLMAEALNKDDAFFLTNGASSGIVASILTLTDKNTEVVVDRNCHISVINGLILSGGAPKYVYPSLNDEFNIPLPIKAEQIDYCGEKLVIITSPTYYGDQANLAEIKEKCGNAIILCDEAHGSHFYFSDKFITYNQPDISVMGFHKTMPVLNQGAVLTVNNNKIDVEPLKKNINIMTTTSPSYPVMASLDYARANGRKIYDEPAFDESVNRLKAEVNLKIHKNTDFYKLLISFDGCALSARQANEKLIKDYKIYAEGVFGNNILFMLSPCNTVNEVNILRRALLSFPSFKDFPQKKDNAVKLPRLETVITPREAFLAAGKVVDKKSAVGKISKQNIIKFPPCVPIVTIGEKITEEIIEFIDSEYVEVVL